MDKDDIKLGDFARILFGQAPPEFLLETFVRTFIIYVALLYTIRWLGKRMSGQLSMNEMAVMLTLGAIVSVAMQVPDRGLLQGFLLLFVTWAFQRGIGLLGVKNKFWEELLQGTTSILVKDGVLQLKEMKDARVTRQQVFSQLRQCGVVNLGMVERFYHEPSGVFSLYKAKEAKPGLEVIPPDDKELFDEKPAVMQLMVCVNCGALQENKNLNCKDCGHDKWIAAK